MRWIDVKDKMPPQGLQVLLEVSGRMSAPYNLVADHGFYLGSWIVPPGETEGHWLIDDGSEGSDYHIIEPEVHAWMPLPEHYQHPQEEDGMEHAMFENDPDWLYKGDYVYTPRKYSVMIGCKDALGYIALMLPNFEKRNEVIERVRYEFERDVPVKPKFIKGIHGMKYDSYSCGHCGNGGKQVIDKFCSNCGFAIDWRNRDEREDQEMASERGDAYSDGKGAPQEAESAEHREIQKDDNPHRVGADEIERVLRDGSQYQGGKIRIHALYHHEKNAKKRKTFLAKEYGNGGRTIELANGDRGFVDFDGKGVTIKSFASDDFQFYSWQVVDKKLERLIRDGEYLTEEEAKKWDALERTPYPEPRHKYPPEADDDEDGSDNDFDEEEGNSSPDEGEDYIQRSLFDGD